MLIRRARIDDAQGMARVIVDTFLQANQGVLSDEALQRRRQEWTYDVSARNWSETLRDIEDGADPSTCIYVAVDGDEIVGLALGCPSEEGGAVGEVGVLYVRADYQRRGIGRRLVQAVAAHLARLGMPVLHIATALASAQSRRFYESLGGQLIGTREDHNDGEPLLLVVYEWQDTRPLVEASAR